MADTTRPNIDWLDATREHLLALQLFTCTTLSVDFRGRDGYVADETLRRVLIRAGHDLSEQGYQEAVAAGNIHDENTRSQALVERAEFQVDGPRGDDYQQWTYAFSW